MRGSGDSEGLYYDEYEKQEQDDCCDVISWISQQDWCTGNVGKSVLWPKWLILRKFLLVYPGVWLLPPKCDHGTPSLVSPYILSDCPLEQLAIPIFIKNWSLMVYCNFCVLIGSQTTVY